MPISSSEIAALNGSYQQQAMQQQSYASSIGQGGSVYGGNYQGQGSDRAMGSAMNMAAGVGAPLAAGAIGLIGLDPMSLGLKTAFSGMAGGMGMGGAMAAGAAVALPLMAAGGAMKYAGGQMMQGANQQMGLNQDLRAGFNFRNQQGGQGFNRSEMTSIGSVVREMSEQFGPGGEIAGFKELSGLAGKMGAMGFAQGVKDVKDFTVRFKDMVKSLKSMATDLGTTLEGAMEFAQAAKSSGVFGMQRSQAFTSAARAATVSGGLALSEVTGAASIGSQIARSVGGRGQQGANAGMRTISQIGTAQQMGLLSEEDIYNVTGQTGAEGRQAYAASSLSKSASFLQSGKGRRMLASMAGKDGTLDENAVQQILSGGMSISETMRQDRVHTTGAGGIGRANFIRNEGRLRGAAMERLGGFLPGLQMKEWAESKGVNFDDESTRDRAMLFAQRQLGMGRDEADQAIKMAQEMPRIIAEQARSEQRDKYTQAVVQARKGQGIEGVKQRFDQAKELINGKLQKVGQDVFNTGSEMVDSFMNDLFHTYVETYSKDIDQQHRIMMRGGASGKAARERAFGMGKGGFDNNRVRAASEGNRGGMDARAKSQNLAESMESGSRGGFLASVKSDLFEGTLNEQTGSIHGQTLDWLFGGGQSGVGKMQEAGYDIHGMSGRQMQSVFKRAEEQREGVTTLDAETAKAIGPAGAGASFIRRAFASKRLDARGDDFIGSMENLVERNAAGDPTSPDTIVAKAVKQQLARKGITDKEKASILGTLATTQDVGAAAAERMGGPEGGMPALLARQRSSGGTPEEQARARGAELGFAPSQVGHGVLNTIANISSFGVQGLIGRLADRGAEGKLALEAGVYADTAQARNDFTGLFSRDTKLRESTITAMEKKLANQVGEDTGETAMDRTLLAGSQLMREEDRRKASGGPAMTEEEKAAWVEKEHPGETLEHVRRTVSGMGALVEERQAKDREEENNRVKSDAKEQRASLRELGVMEASSGKLTTEGQKGLSQAAIDAGNRILGRVQAEEAGGMEYVSDEDIEAEKKDRERLSVKEQKTLAGRLGDVVGAELAEHADVEGRMQHSRKDRQGTVAAMMGVTMTKEEQKQFKGHDDELAKWLANKAGVKGDENTIQGLRGALGAGKNMGLAATGMQEALGSDALRAEREKKKNAEEEAKNPLQAKISKNTEKANQLMEVLILLNKDGNEALRKLDMKNNPERPGGGGGQFSGSSGSSGTAAGGGH